MNQCDRVLAQLHRDRENGHGTCGVDLFGMHIFRYAARVWELRHDRGITIEERPCRRHGHESAIAEYELVFDPATDKPTQLTWRVA